jgi:hypothetical protein
VLADIPYRRRACVGPAQSDRLTAGEKSRKNPTALLARYSIPGAQRRTRIELEFAGSADTAGSSRPPCSLRVVIGADEMQRHVGLVTEHP